MSVEPMPEDRPSTVDEHVERILAALTPLQPYDQPLLEALGLPVCEDISAPMDLPAFDNSAMDGYAVTFDDVVTASEDHPCTCRWWGRWPPARPSSSRSRPVRRYGS